LEIDSADNCHIRGLFITNFAGHGVYIHSEAQSNTIGGTMEGQTSSQEMAGMA